VVAKTNKVQKQIEQGNEEFRLLQEAQTEAAKVAKKTVSSVLP